MSKSKKKVSKVARKAPLAKTDLAGAALQRSAKAIAAAAKRWYDPTFARVIESIRALGPNCSVTITPPAGTTVEGYMQKISSGMVHRARSKTCPLTPPKGQRFIRRVLGSSISIYTVPARKSKTSAPDRL